MTAMRRDFPVCLSKPVTCIRYAHAGVAIRATAEGVVIDGSIESAPVDSVEQLQLLRDLAEERHRELRAGVVAAPESEPDWIDTSLARRLT
jgi:hypothetical protein